ncbi:uncharacterized protein AMSG_12293 [Thecamonas trahens ATCC 50062]|uniref:Valine--tRNA ligase, mitochondrial n=1 Tax=Thecamonas trahens ATCC 50062 TaxID=461836 RepID=A0A0L0DR17_THETB|nr:hypothetical protein AMSG_12293 [Thecamonas trahens ATCC 50062]KNC53878.1 hypothetical protein AMSG_12293 [Thecamonas trahens ATCC 50062]|eukprot:XP_013754286.1 hypothetical protein AMSG_12293 [Thecamonas trahens ATCC 50062]
MTSSTTGVLSTLINAIVWNRVRASEKLQDHILSQRLALVEAVSSVSGSGVSLLDSVPLTEVTLVLVDDVATERCSPVITTALRAVPSHARVLTVPAAITVAGLKAQIFGVLGKFVKRANVNVDRATLGSRLSSTHEFILSIGGKTVEAHNEDAQLQALPAVLKGVESDDGCIEVRLVNEAQYDLDVRAQLIHARIGMLSGRVGAMSDEAESDPEIRAFRRQVIPLIKEEMRNRKGGVYALAPDICSLPLPASTAERLRGEPAYVRFHYMNTWESKTMAWDLLDVPASVLDSLFTNHRKVLRGVPDDASPRDYVLKCYGSADFYVGDTPLADFNSVRRALLRHDHIHISIMSRNDALAMATAEVDEEDLLSALPSADPEEFVHTALSIHPLGAEEVKAMVAPSIASTTLSMWDMIEVPYRVRIRAAQDLKFESTKPKSKKAKKREKQTKKVLKLSDLVVYVEAALYHGSVRLADVQRTAGVLMADSPRWDEELKFDIDVADLPRAARLCVTIFLASEAALLDAVRGQAVEDALPLGAINVPVVDYAGTLKTAGATLALWPFEKANPIATAQQNPARNTAPLLQLQFPAFAGRVVFPTQLGLPVATPPTPDPDADEMATVASLVSKDSVYRLSSAEKDVMWRHRYHILSAHPAGLAKLILSTPYHQRMAVLELYQILRQWPPYASPLDALELLDAQIMDTVVRDFAVNALLSVSDDELSDFMIQLVQALKNENYHDTPLARFLIRRSLRSRRLGHVFFWCLKAEMHIPEVQTRFSLYLEAYCRGCGQHRDELLRQVRLTQSLVESAVYIKQVPTATPEVLQAHLEANVKFPAKVQLVQNPSIEVNGLVLNKCKFMQSKKMPLWLVFANADGQGAPCYSIFKEGDDLRQDMLTLQMIRIMDKMWQQEDMDLRLKPYVAISTGDEVGYIEVVLNAATLADIQVDKGGLAGAFKSTPLADYLRDHNPTDAQYAEAVSNFIVSCAGYCVATYVLGIGDRHNDNIMLDQAGHLFHIDFGHFLGNIKKKFGISRERTPFVLTPDMVHVMGGKDSAGFAEFVSICCRAYNVLRRHSNMLINLFAMMVSTGIPELQTLEDLRYLQRVLKLGASEEEAADYFRSLIDICLKKGWQTTIDWSIHLPAHAPAAALATALVLRRVSDPISSPPLLDVESESAPWKARRVAARLVISPDLVLAAADNSSADGWVVDVHVVLDRPAGLVAPGENSDALAALAADWMPAPESASSIVDVAYLPEATELVVAVGFDAPPANDSVVATAIALPSTAVPDSACGLRAVMSAGELAWLSPGATPLDGTGAVGVPLQSVPDVWRDVSGEAGYVRLASRVVRVNGTAGGVAVGMLWGGGEVGGGGAVWPSATFTDGPECVPLAAVPAALTSALPVLAFCDRFTAGSYNGTVSSGRGSRTGALGALAAAAAYDRFARTLELIDCRQRYSIWSCDDCRDAYARWLCGLSLPGCTPSAGPARIAPCRTLCDDLVKRCPAYFDFGCTDYDPLYWDGTDPSGSDTPCASLNRRSLPGDSKSMQPAPSAVTSSSPASSTTQVAPSYTLEGGGEVVALDGITLDDSSEFFAIKKGEFVMLRGPSGGGKTTLLNLLGTLDKPTDGVVEVVGHAVSAESSDAELAKLRLESIGFVMQNFSLIATMTAFEQTELPMILLGKLNKKERRKRAIELLTYVGLGDRLSHLPSELSGGEQQRVAIARALANRPELLLLDEPTGDLDTANTVAMMDLVLRVNRAGVTVVQVSHNADLECYASRVVYLRGGRFVEQALNAAQTSLSSTDYIAFLQRAKVMLTIFATTISPAGLLQKSIIQHKLAIENLRSNRAPKEEIAAAREELGKMQEELESMLPEERGGDKLKSGKRKEKKLKKLDKKKGKPKGKGGKKSKSKDKGADFTYTEVTPVGEKKQLGEFLEAYQPRAVESAWYEWWEASGFFSQKAEDVAEDQETYVIVIPPPNVTGSLHLGHALTNAVQDTLVRWQRMQGKAALWVPGVDHAGIATQVVVEKKIMREDGLTRHDLGREAFVDKVWEWKAEYGARITNQLRKLGSSLDWEREVFTMDETRAKAVTEAFVRLHKKGLIYRDNRLVNWSCQLKTAISDIEVDYIDLDGIVKRKVPNHDGEYLFGCIISFAYKICDADGVLDADDDEIVVATTRLETMLGDTAVCIHPADPRYSHLHGKFVKHPYLERVIPIVLDDELVDMSFGTGAVKITPAHDPNDYALGLKHELPLINVLNEDGTMNNECGQYAGMMRFDVRTAMLADLKERGLYRGLEANPGMRLGLCSRSGDVVEPMLKPQWYMSCTELAQRGIDAAASGDLNIVPESQRKNWQRWLEDIPEWCISRQLWWGHRIPAWRISTSAADAPDSGLADNDAWVVERTEAEARTAAAAKLGVAEDDVVLVQDDDVLDTWFSSGLFPFSVFGWPDETPDLKTFFPTALLETGQDILFFWVARMVMMSFALMDELPFSDVFLHAMVRDAHGRKMSKSLGNVIDPLAVISGISLEELKNTVANSNLPQSEVAIAQASQEADFPDGIPECGTDALRFGLCSYTGTGGDVNLDIDRVVGYRNFCNKLWNATRYAVFHCLGDNFQPWTATEFEASSAEWSPADQWILASLNEATVSVNANLAKYNFIPVTSTLYEFWWGRLCAYYIELCKPVITSPETPDRVRDVTRQTLYTAMEAGFRLLHPFMPFITEELWQRLPRRPEHADAGLETIMLAEYPQDNPAFASDAILADFAFFQAALTGARALRAEYGLSSAKQKAPIYLSAATDDARASCERYATYVEWLAFAESVTVVADGEAPRQCAVNVFAPGASVHLELKAGVVNVDRELAKLAKKKTALVKEVTKIEKKMANPAKWDKVPEAAQVVIVEKLEAAKVELVGVDESIAMFEAMKPGDAAASS